MKLIVCGWLSAGLAAASSTLIVSAPASASPGSSLAVAVTASGSFTQVLVQGQGPIGFSKVLTAPPYNFLLPIPGRTPSGIYSVTALGLSGGGQISSAPITVSVERTDAPVQVDVVPTTVRVPVGGRIPLTVIGTYADGSKLDITRSATTAFSMNSAGVAVVDSQGEITALSPGTARILVNNSFSVPVTVPVTLTMTPEDPVVYASQSAQLFVMAPGAGSVPVTWSIGSQPGRITQTGLYTAPNSITTQQIVNVTATLRSGATITGGVVLFPPVALTVFPPGPVSLSAGQTTRFAQTVYNAMDEDVTWSVSPKNAGTIDSTGLYTAPASVKSPQTVTITATSVANPGKSATATVLLHP
ncbi:MAG TPA: Ig-like domain-containing protein [Bryobacteraceae bacterium]